MTKSYIRGEKYIIVVGSILVAFILAMGFHLSKDFYLEPNIEIKMTNVYPWVLRAEMGCDFSQQFHKNKYSFAFHVPPFSTSTFSVPRKNDLQKCEVSFTLVAYTTKRETQNVKLR
jgi:hypothetical protein